MSMGRTIAEAALLLEENVDSKTTPVCVEIYDYTSGGICKWALPLSVGRRRLGFYSVDHGSFRNRVASVFYFLILFSGSYNRWGFFFFSIFFFFFSPKDSNPCTHIFELKTHIFGSKRLSSKLVWGPQNNDLSRLT